MLWYGHSLFLKANFFLIEVSLIHNVVLVSGIHQSESVTHTHIYIYVYTYIYIYIYFIFFSLIGCYRILSIIHCAIQQVPVGLSILYICIGEGNGNPLQCSCLENPRDGEAWWAAVSGVAQSRTRLKQLSSSSSRSSSIYLFIQNS